MSKTAYAIAATALGVALGLPAHAQLLSHKDLSVAIATTIATAAIDACKAQGYNVPPTQDAKAKWLSPSAIRRRVSPPSNSRRGIYRACDARAGGLAVLPSRSKAIRTRRSSSSPCGRTGRSSGHGRQ
jgi:hypothetical protein